MPTDVRRPLAAFDDDVVARVARENGVDETALRDALRDHQRGVRSLPGVDDIVYEWRRTLPRDPLLERRPDAYFLAVEPAVWVEFVAALGVSDVLGDALRAVHEAQLAAVLGTPAVPEGDWEPLVLTRP